MVLVWISWSCKTRVKLQTEGKKKRRFNAEAPHQFNTETQAGVDVVKVKTRAHLTADGGKQLKSSWV